MITSRRYRNDMPECQIDRRFVRVGDAISNFILCDVSWGGRTVRVDSCEGVVSIEIHTPILRHTEIAIFRGPLSEMEPMVRAVVALSQVPGRVLINAIADGAVRITGGNPLLLSAIGGMMVGRCSSAIAMAGVLNLSQEAEISRLVSILSRDHDNGVEFLSAGIPIGEVAELMGV